MCLQKERCPYVQNKQIVTHKNSSKDKIHYPANILDKNQDAINKARDNNFSLMIHYTG